MSDGVSHEFNVAVTDDPGFQPHEGASDDVVDLVTRWRQHVVTIVFPQVFTIMSQPPHSP